MFNIDLKCNNNNNIKNNINKSTVSQMMRSPNVVFIISEKSKKDCNEIHTIKLLLKVSNM